ncbi:MAG: hypothetical protein RR144_02680, partial [Clostridia bacterium]
IIIFIKYKLNKNIKNIKLILNFILIISTIYIIYFNIYTEYISSFVYYFNVEQGNMAVIKQGKTVILVDMGTTRK